MGSRLGPLADTASFPPDNILFGTSSRMQQVRLALEYLATTDLPVVISGKSGTGKQVVARFIHVHSPYSSGPLVKISCAGVPASHFELEVLGYEKSSFSGAAPRFTGHVERFTGGTLLFCGITDLELAAQAKLLELCRDLPAGGSGGPATPTKTRIICTTRHSLESAVASGSFREDLYHCLQGALLQLPDLQERATDIPEIAEYLLRKFSAFYRVPVKPLGRALHRRLQQHSWPGNIRELENMVRRYALLGTASAVAEALTASVVPGAPLESEYAARPLTTLSQRAVREFEVAAILRALELHGGNVKRAAQFLKVSCRTLSSKMRALGIQARRES